MSCILDRQHQRYKRPFLFRVLVHDLHFGICKMAIDFMFCRELESDLFGRPHMFLALIVPVFQLTEGAHGDRLFPVLFGEQVGGLGVFPVGAGIH